MTTCEVEPCRSKEPSTSVTRTVNQNAEQRERGRKTKTGQSPTARDELKSFVCVQAAGETCPSRVTELRAESPLHVLRNSQLLPSHS